MFRRLFLMCRKTNQYANDLYESELFMDRPGPEQFRPYSTKGDDEPAAHPTRTASAASFAVARRAEMSASGAP